MSFVRRGSEHVCRPATSSAGAVPRRLVRLPAAVALLLMLSGQAQAATWREAVAGERDTVAFFGAHGELLRAPFDLATRETLWAPDGAEHLVRLAVAPDGVRLAWLTRSGDRTATTLWLWDRDGTRRVAAYWGLVPSDYGSLRFEAVMPSVDDPEIVGERWLIPSSATRTGSCNAMAWMWDGSALLFGYRDGLARAPLDTGLVRVVSPALVMGLRRLDPAPMLLADVIHLGQGRFGDIVAASPELSRDGTGRARGVEESPGERTKGQRVVAQPGSYLLYPVGREMRIFSAPDLLPTDPWTASPGTLWWVENKRRLRAVRAHDPKPTLERESKDPIVWLEYVAGRRSVLTAAGRAVIARPEDPGPESTLLATGRPIETVLAAAGATLRAVVTHDSLIAWEPATGVSHAIALGGVSPTALLHLEADTWVVVDAEGRHPSPALYRLDLEAGRLETLSAPEVRGGRVSAGPGGRTLLIAAAGAHRPTSVSVYDLATRQWSEAQNPGITGWELLTPH